MHRKTLFVRFFLLVQKRLKANIFDLSDLCRIFTYLNLGVTWYEQGNEMENFITAEKVRSVLTYDKLTTVMEQALSQYSSRHVVQPVRSVVSVQKEGG